MTIDANTDTIIRSQGVDESSLLIFTPGAQWRIDLDPDIASIPVLERQVNMTTNQTANISVQASNVGAALPSIPQTRVLIQVVNNATGALNPISGSLAQVYMTVVRIFKEAQP